jgi:hypothetical protein
MSVDQKDAKAPSAAAPSAQNELKELVQQWLAWDPNPQDKQAVCELPQREGEGETETEQGSFPELS